MRELVWGMGVGAKGVWGENGEGGIERNVGLKGVGCIWRDCLVWGGDNGMVSWSLIALFVNLMGGDRSGIVRMLLSERL